MDRIWQWTWDRFGPRHQWAALAVLFPAGLPIYVFWSFLVVAVEGSNRYLQAAVITVVVVLAPNVIAAVGDRGRYRPVERWAAGHDVDRATALTATYSFARSAASRALWASAVSFALISVIVGAMAGSGWPR